ncbi:amidohydrolase [Streptomyces abyssalis]|uniref:Amidohydrolase n=1 Tax=Streptomyces abyssalis TaxID=933944 RepID=A0A1E7JV26_9ACTN|nr:amidohydrolase [Streptomyces abyssalis]OEU93807.1 amidohydrolase [Streptomyces abyssalis]
MAALKELLRPLVAFYLDLHRNPELSGSESRTAARFAGWLEGEGYDVARGVGGHGVVGVLRNGDGPRVMLRAELDALPVRERTGLAYASEGPAMHACGHDMHLAALAGAASLLARAAGGWRGTVVVVGQPAEETLEGARAMLRDGLYERFGVPAAALAQHTAPLPAGMVAHAGESVPVLAGSAGMEVVVHGRGGHAGAPHLAVDPLVTAAAVVMRLQGLAARETAPAEQAVVNAGSLHAGSGSNVIAERAELGITVRAQTQASLERLTAAVERTVSAECAAAGCPREPEIRIVSRSPVTVSDPETGAAVREAHRRLYGPERVCGWLPSAATEDFALYGDAGAGLHGATGIAAVYWMVGATGAREWSRASGNGSGQPPPGPPPGNHSPRFAPDVRTGLPTAVTAMTTAALTCLGGAEPGGAGPGGAGPGVPAL